MLPKYMGETVLKKCSSMEIEPKPDFSYSGEVFASGALVLNDRPVFLAIDLSRGLLCSYDSQSQYVRHETPQSSVLFIDIYGVRECTPGLFSDKAKYYFILTAKSGPVKYYTRKADTTSEWISSIRHSVEHCQIKKIGFIGTGRVDTSPPMLPVASEPVVDPGVEDEAEMMETEGIYRETVNFSSFTVQQELGSGSFGKVYKVIKNNSNRVYAMKCLSKGFLIEHQQLEHAISECKILQELNHPFIIKLNYAFQTPKNLYMVLDYCPNGDLMAHLSERSKFGESVSRFYAAEVLLALEYVHSLDIVYRDLKPENLLLDRAGHIRLADFGLAKENVNHMNPALTFCGSPAYLAPELVERKGAEKSADVYAFGVLIFEMLAGSPPFFTDNPKTLYKNIQGGNLEFPSSMKPEARDLIRKVMNRDPMKRPAIFQLKTHPFFKGIDWERLLAMRIRPPRLGPGWKQMDEAGDVIELEMNPGSSHVIDEDYESENADEALIGDFNY